MTQRLAAFLLVISSLPANAQSAADLQQVDAASKRYNGCVYQTAVDHFRPRDGVDISSAAELAFRACATEADQLTFLMKQHGLTPLQIEGILLNKKTAIKEELRRMSLEAAGFTVPAAPK